MVYMYEYKHIYLQSLYCEVRRFVRLQSQGGRLLGQVAGITHLTAIEPYIDKDAILYIIPDRDYVHKYMVYTLINKYSDVQAYSIV